MYCVFQIKNKQHTGLIITDETKKEFEDFWAHYKTQPLTGRDVILSSFCPQVIKLFKIVLNLYSIYYA